MLKPLPFAPPNPPVVRVARSADGPARVSLAGAWTLRGLAEHAERLFAELKPYTADAETRWDLTGIEALDSAGAFILWRASEGRRPAHLQLRPEHAPLLRRWSERRVLADPGTTRRPFDPLAPLARLGRLMLDHACGFLALLGQFVLDLLWVLRHPRRIPWRDISATLYQTGTRALGVTALVGFFIGIAVSYLSSLQLRSFGAETLIVNILGLGIIRELGPMLAAVIVAGRSGAAMAAQFGVMRVTQEFDALQAMGVSPTLRLVLPKIVALVVALPLLIVWTDALALAGGMLAARATLGVELEPFLERLPAAVPVANFWLGLGKGAVFGLVVGLVACHFGLRIKPNTESLGVETTSAVVVAITGVMLVDAVFAILLRNVGFS